MNFEFPITETVRPLILDPAQKQGNYIAKVKWHVRNLTQAMDRLKARRDDNLQLVKAAEDRQEIRTSEVKDWIQKVSDMETRVARIQERYDNRYLLFGWCGVNCWSNYRIGKAAAEKLPIVEKLLADGAFATLTTRLQPPPAEEEPNTPKVVGMETNLGKALSYIDDSRAGIIGIWGIGGVGKTTLLRSINNSFLPGSKRSADFHHVILAVASKALDIHKLQQDIASKLELKLDKEAGTSVRASAIRSFLKKKNFLLLLDDLWERLDLDKVGIPHPRGSSTDGRKLMKQVVVITSRSESVCGVMEAHTRLKVECLEWAEAWELFKDKVGEGTIGSDQRIPALAEDLARECRGLPLALVVTGRDMSTKRDFRDWKNAIAMLRVRRQHAMNSGTDSEEVVTEYAFEQLAT